MNNLNTILTLLKRIQIGERENHRGICTNIKWLFVGKKLITTEKEEIEADKLYRCFMKWLGNNVSRWSKFSGDNVYPVPAPNNIDPNSSYWKIENKWEGEYGELRKEFLQWCIEQITIELE
jgi:hypothetical protein